MINRKPPFFCVVRYFIITAFLMQITSCAKGEPDVTNTELPTQDTAPTQDVGPTRSIEDRLGDLQKCSLAAGQKLGINPVNYHQKLADLGLTEELRSDAESIAADKVAQYAGIFPSGESAQKTQLYLVAIDSVASISTTPPDTKLKAKAYAAYYESKLTGADCPVDPDILQLIKKS